MEAAILEAYLRRGLSLDAIGRLTGRDPSTVGYWVKRHGLAAVHRDRHAPKGGIDRDTLATLVEQGLSTRQIAERVGLSQSTVRHLASKARIANGSGASRQRPWHSGGPSGQSRAHVRAARSD